LSPLAKLAGLVFPACGASGAEGLMRPAPGELRHLQRPASPNSALAAPEDFPLKPDFVLPIYPIPATALFDAICRVAAAAPRTYLQAIYPENMEARWVARSELFNFPDVIVAQVSPRGEDKSSLVLYSRSEYGYSDLGVNRARLKAWIGALERSLH